MYWVTPTRLAEVRIAKMPFNDLEFGVPLKIGTINSCNYVQNDTSLIKDENTTKK